MNTGIYAIKNIINKKLYIGQTKNLSRRKRQHYYKLENDNHYNDHLQKSFNKYGKKAFKFFILERCEIKELDKKEMIYIKKYKTIDRDKGYNLKGGGHKPKLSDYSKNKISKTRKERIAKGIIKVRKNFTFTEKQKERMSKAQKKSYSENPEIKIKISKAKSTISDKAVRRIKQLLYLDMDILEISKILDVNIDKIRHIMYLDSFEYVLPKLNYYINNRENIYREKIASKTLRFYRDGYTQEEIGQKINRHRRSAVRIIDEYKSNFDIKMRKRTKLFKRNKKYRLAKLMYSKGWNTVELAEKFRISRGTIKKILDGKYNLNNKKLP